MRGRRRQSTAPDSEGRNHIIDKALAAALRRELLRWFDRAKRVMPWRGETDPYRIWISEIILQQTRVEQGTPYYLRFIKAFPTVEALVKAREDRVLKLWEGLGYYSRARNALAAARMIVSRFGGTFPRDVEALESLPGVGRYTAGAIASIAFGVRAPVLDGNVARVLTRLFDIDEPVASGPTRERLWALAETLVPARRPGDFNQALMELGATLCAPKAPDCAACPLAKRCAALARGVQGLRPVKQRRAATPHERWVAGLISNRDGAYLLVKRPSRGLLAGLWEFPGGVAREGESPKTVLRRILLEDFGVAARVRREIAAVDHEFSHLRITLLAFKCEWVAGSPALTRHAAWAWVAPSRLGRLALPRMCHKLLEALDSV